MGALTHWEGRGWGWRTLGKVTLFKGAQNTGVGAELEGVGQGESEAC